MTSQDVKDRVGDVPWMRLEQGVRLREFILDHGIRDVLELGFYHGVSTCYMAAALAEAGGGSITTIDKEKVRELRPGIEELLERIGHRAMVTIYHEPVSYNWRLMKLIEQDPEPRFDLCYVDGAHTWYADGFAFFLADRLLRPNGWFLFDDLNWSYATCPVQAKSGKSDSMPAEEAATPQVRKVYELLVKSHPSYDDFRVEGNWAFARKRPNAEGATLTALRRETEVRLVPVPWELLKERLRESRRDRHEGTGPDDTAVPKRPPIR